MVLGAEVLRTTTHFTTMMLVAAALSPPPPPACPANTHVLNGYSVPGKVWAWVLLCAKTGAAPAPMGLPLQRRTDLNKGTNKIISENESLGRK